MAVPAGTVFAPWRGGPAGILILRHVRVDGSGWTTELEARVGCNVEQVRRQDVRLKVLHGSGDGGVRVVDAPLLRGCCGHALQEQRGPA